MLCTGIFQDFSGEIISRWIAGFH